MQNYVIYYIGRDCISIVCVVGANHIDNLEEAREKFDLSLCKDMDVSIVFTSKDGIGFLYISGGPRMILPVVHM